MAVVTNIGVYMVILIHVHTYNNVYTHSLAFGGMSLVLTPCTTLSGNIGSSKVGGELESCFSGKNGILLPLPPECNPDISEYNTIHIVCMCACVRACMCVIAILRFSF